jgi:hypothetical protein
MKSEILSIMKENGESRMKSNGGVSQRKWRNQPYRRKRNHESESQLNTMKIVIKMKKEEK